ncbi:MAG: hypothetical protein LBC41_14260 [Clostridiales bacterium]|nr:hypothetical protein [Clostridiales bacterium]
MREALESYERSGAFKARLAVTPRKEPVKTGDEKDLVGTVKPKVVKPSEKAPFVDSPERWMPKPLDLNNVNPAGQRMPPAEVPQSGRIFTDEERKSSSQDLNSQRQKKGDLAGRGTSPTGQRRILVIVPLYGMIFVHEEWESRSQDRNDMNLDWFYNESHELSKGAWIAAVVAVLVFIVLIVNLR